MDAYGLHLCLSYKFIFLSLFQITNMKKEIDAIRAKDISQGGLTQGQQTQIARNEQRTSQVSGSNASHLLALPFHIILPVHHQRVS